MFRNSTVFILGAGASWHYGYPTGEDLVKMVIERADAAARYFSHQIDGQVGDLLLYITEAKRTGSAKDLLKGARDEAKELASRLRQVNPMVIDYFLGQNPTFSRSVRY